MQRAQVGRRPVAQRKQPDEARTAVKSQSIQVSTALRRPRRRKCCAPKKYPVPVALVLDGLVAMARAPTPDPIPNSAVKALSADGTAS